MKVKLILSFLFVLTPIVVCEGETIKYKKSNYVSTIKETLNCLQSSSTSKSSCPSIHGLLEGDIKFKNLYIEAWGTTGRTLKESLTMASDFNIDTIDNVKYLYWDMWCKYDSCTDKYNIDFAYMLYNIESGYIVGIFTDSKDKLNTIGNLNEKERQLLDKHKDHPELFDH